MSPEEPIMSFRGEFDFLSNFFPQPIAFEGRVWLTSEHAYQAAKTLVVEEWQQIRDAPSAGKAKRLGKSKADGGIVTLRPDWYDVRVPIMHAIQEAKFEVPALEERLLSTGNIKLVEGNVWGDTFWGVDIRTGIGKNVLGKLLMQIREEKRSFG